MLAGFRMQIGFGINIDLFRALGRLFVYVEPACRTCLCHVIVIILERLGYISHVYLTKMYMYTFFTHVHT